MLLLSVVLVVMASVIHMSEAFSYGAAETACEDMMPAGGAHGDVAQTSKVPYNFSLNSQTVRSGGSVEHTILQKEGGPTFEGFMVQARSGTSVKPIGTFQPKTANASAMRCSNNNDTGSHNSSDPKNNMTLIWTPPSDFKGQITFYCTVVSVNGFTFWVRQKCGTITVKVK